MPINNKSKSNQNQQIKSRRVVKNYCILKDTIVVERCTISKRSFKLLQTYVQTVLVW